MLKLSPDVEEGVETGSALVALESAVISHGLPHPTNLTTARRMEAIIREQGALPATVAVLGGSLRVGLTDAELEHLATAKHIRKASRRDLPVLVSSGGDGATTVAATATIASWAGIKVFATGGIGGVHRDAPFDISNDLPTLASVPVAVVCAGAKSVLDLGATLEWLETAGVPVIGYGTDEFPAFYSRTGGLPVDARADSAEEAAAIIHAGFQMRQPGGMLVAVPVPAGFELSPEYVEAAVASALSEAQARSIEGSALTPFLLDWMARYTNGRSIRANVALLENNARVAAQISVALKRMTHSVETDQRVSERGDVGRPGSQDASETKLKGPEPHAV
jgi:pseudouridine-5'-phosphate glycosidase